MSRRSGALMVCGTTSGAGKSTITAALCRSWARQGLRTAPFKAQNMSNHAAVTADGGEVGRAQAMQARAAGVEVERRMNPVLLKPSSDNVSHVVVLGDEVSVTDARDYGPSTRRLRPVVLEALSSLRHEYDWVVAEGAGGAAEINLLDRDLVNLPLARAAGLAALLVVDIDRGGAFASAHGTIDLLPRSLSGCIGGIVFNSFRGDPSLLVDGVAELERRSKVPVLGVLPYLAEETMLGVEDFLDIRAGLHSRARSAKPVRVAAIRLPRLANPSDLDPFVVEPDVEMRWVTRPDELAAADLIVIPGSRATVADLVWLRRNGLAEALKNCDAPIIGICAGYQMLGQRIHDEIESDSGTVAGLGLLDVETRFEHPKVVCRCSFTVGGLRIEGYQIRFGRIVSRERPWFSPVGDSGDCVIGDRVVDAGLSSRVAARCEGAVSRDGRIRASSVHGLFDADGFRSELLGAVAVSRGRDYRPKTTSYHDALEAHHEHLADWLEAHIDTSALLDLAASANPVGSEPGW
ncbi:MAG: cobyric acid synthase [Acidimicrobiaceae bacterium]|nr:cobyric acid synthase [Acidimicrobiaceae bacterium]MXW75190.1 cobyric acid synthase [Acidimicrobiaceae bacterium]MYA74095.1 cobyric acid synthase [Acidimicrobiaceae bacterium]MYC42390.1 cobyric acid synthase [Acidimicrobiaceae bacterium]MYD06271.1 cobyric acid synthase [Acidimicrobiaceae bacterium]